jgi:hypothetical protein
MKEHDGRSVPLRDSDGVVERPPREVREIDRAKNPLNLDHRASPSFSHGL